MKSQKAIEFEIGCLAAKLKKGDLDFNASHAIQMQIRILYWVLGWEIKDEFSWTRKKK